MVNVTELRAEIEAEAERMTKRPVPTAPWAMPLSLDDLKSLLDVVERARAVIKYFGSHGPPDQKYVIANLELALERFS